MTKEQIKKAVDEYIGYPPEMDEGIETTMRRNAFKDGANWRINSVWHDAEERPKFPGKVELVKFLLLFKNGECGYSQISKDDWDDIKEVAKFVKWAYVGDLIPSKTERKSKSKTMDENQVTMWMARDENGKLAVYNSKPNRFEKMKVWMPHCIYDNYIYVSSDLFPSVKWEDAEPTEVVLTLKKSMKDRKYLLFKKFYRTTLENTIEIKTDMQMEYETYRVEYTIKWSTIFPYKAVHDRLIRVLLLLLRKARMDTRIKKTRR